MFKKLLKKIFKKKEKIYYSQFFECWFYDDDFLKESDNNV